MKIRFQTFAQYHNKKDIGSTKIRVENLIKYWPEADLYTYGEKPDVLIFQKVYAQPDYDWPLTLDAIKILDVCDPDWLDDQPIRQTIEAMDAVTVPTAALQEFIMQMTDKPVRIVKDRFDISEFPAKPKNHYGKAKNLVWFGYAQNANKLKGAINTIQQLDMHLTVISNKEPSFMSWAETVNFKESNYQFKTYKSVDIYYELTKYDIAILPDGSEPQDRFKSENKEIIANLCGLPVVKSREQLELMLDPKARNEEVKKKHASAIKNYDVQLSVQEFKRLIDEIKAKRN